MSQEKKEVMRMQERLASLVKEHDTAKKVLLATKRKIAMRALMKKLKQLQEANKRLRHTNQTLMGNNQSLRKELVSVQRKYEVLREFTTTYDFQLDDDDLRVISPAPKSPEFTTSQVTIDNTPKRASQNRAQSDSQVAQILYFDDDDNSPPKRKRPCNLSVGTATVTRKSKRISSKKQT